MIIKKILEDSAAVKKELAKQAPLIGQIAGDIVTALKKGGKVLIFGNGGSAADSQHLAAELVGRFRREKRPLPAIALTTNTSVLTAIGNDYGYDFSFSKQLEAHAKKGDIAVAISTSGNAKNVVEAVLAAKRMKVRTIGLTGKAGGLLSRACDLTLKVPSDKTARVQEAHITVIHIICELVEEAFCSEK